MKIGVNARLLIKPFTGIGQYTRNLFRELAKIDSENEYILVVPEKIDTGIEKEFPSNIKVIIIPEMKIGTAGIKKTWWEQISVPEFFIAEGVDVAFFTYPSNPWTKDFYKKNIKTVVTIHDCIPWMHKNYRRSLMAKLYHGRTKRSVGLADLIFTVSKSSKKDIEKVCDVDGHKIHVVYNDASDSYKVSPGKKESDDVLKRFSLSAGRYFLYVGGYDARKNVELLKSEYSDFASDREDVMEASIPLVLAGGKLYDSKLYESFDMKNCGNLVETGFLKEEHLNILYRNCAAFVNLSTHEGFNIPILEAANCGAPMILSDIPVHREIAGNVALFVDVTEKGKVSKAFSDMLSSQNHEGFSEDSLKLAKKYSWSSSAQKMKDVLFS